MSLQNKVIQLYTLQPEIQMAMKIYLDAGKKEILLDIGEEVTELMFMAVNGRLDLVDEILHNGADPSACTSQGINALHLAALGGHQAIIERLMAAGVDVMAKDKKGRSAIDYVKTGKELPPGIFTFIVD